MSSENELPDLIEFSVEGITYAPFLILRISGEEAVSDLYCFKLIVAFEQKTSQPTQFLLKKATLNYPTFEKRYHQGVITKFKEMGYVQPYFIYEIEMRPILWLATKGKNRKIYHKMNLQDIIKDVFSQINFKDYKIDFKNTYTKKDYVTQFDESNFDFLSRLFQYYGVFYYFTHDEKTSTMVICDNQNSFATVEDQEFETDQDISEKYQQEIFDDIFQLKKDDIKKILGKKADTTDRTKKTNKYFYNEHPIFISTPQIMQNVTVDKVTISDYNYQTSTADLSTTLAQAESQIELYQYPADISQVSNKDNAVKNRLNAESAAKFVIAARVYAPVLIGSKITISDDHTFNRQEIKGKKFKVLKIKHSFTRDNYDCRIEAIPEETVYAPPVTLEKPQIFGSHLALVVGSESDEVYAGEYAAIRIQFFWDRYGKKDQNSSIDVRVAQLWGGKSGSKGKVGAFFLPRIGQEVVVTFIDGDPDRPLVTGVVYNDKNEAPLTPAEAQSKSTIRSWSTKNGSAGNEITFDDSHGKENFIFSANKDYTLTIKEKRTESVGTDDTTTITKGNRSLTIKEGNYTITLNKGNISIQTTGDVSIKSTGNLKLDAGGDFSLNAKSISMKSMTGTSLQAGTSLALNAETSGSFQSNLGLTLASNMTMTAGGKLSTTITGLSVSLNSDVNLSAKGLIVQVSGEALASVQGVLTKIG